MVEKVRKISRVELGREVKSLGVAISRYELCGWVSGGRWQFVRVGCYGGFDWMGRG